MDFNDTPDEAAYRARARAWLDKHAPKYGFPIEQDKDLDFLSKAKAWQAEKAAAGYACITWPKDWGGPGGTAIQDVIFGQEEGPYRSPSAIFTMGTGMCVPTIMAVADDDTKRRFVAPAMSGQHVWCQLFSEPSGGSDLAGVRTRAVRTDDGSEDWIIDGQKVWTTAAHLSDYGMIITRTDQTVPKHKGLTMFWLDMKTPGIEIRPIHQMRGGSRFNEVFLTNVRIPDSHRIGAVNDGWRVSLITLMNERVAVSGTTQINWSHFMRAARDIPGMMQDRALREKLADWYVQAEGVNHVRARTITALSKGQTPGPEGSVAKLALYAYIHDMSSEALDMMDQYGIIDDPALSPQRGELQTSFMHVVGNRIAGGTDEIMRNIIAERVLGLPGDVRVDKDVPFADIPTGA